MDDGLDFNIEMQQQPSTQESKAETVSKEEKPSLMPKFLQGAAHPRYCILHFAFKVVALVFYIVLGLVLADQTIVFILVTTMHVFDFWVVKNITGR